MFLKAEPTCAHHDNVSIKANIIEIDAGCVWNTEPSEVQGIFQSRKVLLTIYSCKQNRHVHITTTCRSRPTSSKMMQVVCGIIFQDCYQAEGFWSIYQQNYKHKEAWQLEKSCHESWRPHGSACRMKGEPTCANHDNVSMKACMTS